jgi:hypothetical protein
MSGDERYAWFCFSNPDEAEAALGPPPRGRREHGGRPVDVVINQYEYVFEFSDVYNAAEFVRETSLATPPLDVP